MGYPYIVPLYQMHKTTPIKGQAMADLLINFPGTSDFSLSQQEVLVTEEQEWSMHINGLSTSQGGGIGVVLTLLGEEHTFSYKLHFPCSNNKHTFAYKLHFPCSNNEVEYKALVV